MLNPAPLQPRWQRIAILPLALMLLVVAGGGVAWLQRAQSAAAEPLPPEPYVRFYEGAATVKVKLGNSFLTYNMKVCAAVETNGTNGAITDAVIFGSDTLQLPGSDSGESFCDLIGDCVCEGVVASSAVSGGPLINNNGYGFAPGTFVLVTQIRHALDGVGWKPPVQLTSQSASFTLQSPYNVAAGVYLNQDLRAMTASSNLTVKFLRNRGGLYFKSTGFVQLVPNGPKVSIEIESAATGLDSPPEVTYITPDYEFNVDSDTSVVVSYTEPVNVDPAGVILECSVDLGPWVAVPFTISGQGTATITVDPFDPLPLDADCYFEIEPEAVDDVDTFDPPANNFFSGIFTFFGTEPSDPG